MYPHFIEVHWYSIPISYNIENITWFGDKFLYIVGQDEALDCDESYTDIKNLLKSSGCHIEKADPRLDTSRPLTFEDLQQMVGQPVWNSNLDVWMIVKSCSDLYADMVNPSGNISAWEEKDLIEFPLYRMKVQNV